MSSSSSTTRPDEPISTAGVEGAGAATGETRATTPNKRTQAENQELAHLENKQTQTTLTDKERIRLNDLRAKQG